MKFIKLFLFVLLFQSQSYAQVQNWVLGTGFNFVDDDGKASSLFNLKNGWNGLPFPSSFYCEKYFNKSLSVEFSESVNSYKIGNEIDQVIIKQNIFFMSVDMNAKYHFNSLYNKSQWLDPYIIGGLGITMRGKNVVPNPNIGFGATFWVSNRLGINVQSSAKFKITTAGSNYLQHALGVRIRF